MLFLIRQLWRIPMDSNKLPTIINSLSPTTPIDVLASILSTSQSTTTASKLSNGTDSVAELTKTLIPAKYQVILLSFAYGIISFLAVVGNSCIIYIIIRNRRMHSVTNYFICNLALADCLVACFATPFQVIFQISKWIFILFSCFVSVHIVSSCCTSKMGVTTFSL